MTGPAPWDRGAEWRLSAKIEVGADALGRCPIHGCLERLLDIEPSGLSEHGIEGIDDRLCEEEGWVALKVVQGDRGARFGIGREGLADDIAAFGGVLAPI